MEREREKKRGWDYQRQGAVCRQIPLIFSPGHKHNKRTSTKRSKRSEYLHFIIYISGALQLAPDTSRRRETAGARIPLAGTPDTVFFFLIYLFWRARAQEASYKLQHGGKRHARARGRVSWKHRPSVSTTARSRASPAVQSGAQRRDGGLCWACGGPYWMWVRG